MKPLFAIADCILDRLQQPAFVERLLDKIESSALDCRNGHVDVAMAGDEYDRKGLMCNAAHQVQARGARRTHVGNDAIKFSLAMLTCLDRDHRVAYILGDVFDLPHRVAAHVVEASDEVYRQRLSRARRQVEACTRSYCGVVNDQAPCRCDRRVASSRSCDQLSASR